jgi:hypothetical protein
MCGLLPKKRLDTVSNLRIGFPPQPKAAIHVKN